jgi:hypothetical protein
MLRHFPEDLAQFKTISETYIVIFAEFWGIRIISNFAHNTRFY